MCLKWHRTTTEIAKRNTVNKEILINKKKGSLTHKKKFAFLKKYLVLRKKRFALTEKKFVYAQKSHGK